MSFKQKENNKIRYIVHLKDRFYMPKTTITREFCGYIDNIAGNTIYFRLHGSNALVIIPHNEIEWMAPSRILWEEGFTFEER